MSGTQTAPTELLAGLGDHGKQLAARGPEWLRGLRRQRLARFEELGLPSPRAEEWRNTSLAPLRGTKFQPVARLISRGVLV